MPHGVTNKMRNIPGPLSAAWLLKMGIKSRIVVSHNGLNRSLRRHPLWVPGESRRGDGMSRTMFNHDQPPATNVPYVNVARDNRKGRRLRKELRNG